MLRLFQSGSVLCAAGLVVVGSLPAMAQSGSRNYPPTRSSGRTAPEAVSSQRARKREALGNAPELWSGCVSGAFREDRFLKAFEEAGFHGIEIAVRQSEPWRTVEGIEFRSLTVVARKGKQGPCLERNQAVVYRGPFKKVEDDDDHVYYRGERMAVCDKTFRLLGKEPYAAQFEFVEPLEAVPPEKAKPFDCGRPRHRHPRETKGQEYDATTEVRVICTDSGNCC